jgi:hypothetical protein
LQRPEWQERIRQTQLRDPAEHVPISRMQGLQRAIETETFSLVCCELTTHLVLALENADVMTGRLQSHGRHESGETRPHHRDIH